MKFMLLMLHETDATRRDWTEAREREAYRRMTEFDRELDARGVRVTCDALHGDGKGVRIRSRDGETRWTDGPFTESKEVIGGFFIIECATKEEAVALARRCPHAEWGTVEVRETRVGPDLPQL